MKMKFIFLLLLLCFFVNGFSQYIGVRARYTGTRLVDNSPNAPARENRLILSFWNIDASGNYTPATLTNYDMYVYKGGLQYGSLMGGVLDSSGNNYAGYSYTAPAVVSYFNTYCGHCIDCDPNAADHYIVNGHELDCGWVNVSYWLYDETADRSDEYFTAPNVILPLPDFYPGGSYFAINLNFGHPIGATAPYNLYNYVCAGSTLQLVYRGVMPFDTSTAAFITLPVTFVNVKAVLTARGSVMLNWSNATESDIDYYDVERSVDGLSFNSVAHVTPKLNNGDKASYEYEDFNSFSERVFYRIKVVENTGTFLYSPVMNVVKNKERSMLSVFPNPIQNGLVNIELSDAESGHYILSVINSNVQVVRQKMINHTNGDLIKQIDLTGLPRGIYQVVLWTNTKRYTASILNFQ